MSQWQSLEQSQNLLILTHFPSPFSSPLSPFSLLFPSLYHFHYGSHTWLVGLCGDQLIQCREMLSAPDSIQLAPINENVTGPQQGKETGGVTASQESPPECKAAQGQCGALAAVFDLKEAATYKLWVWLISMHAVLFLIFFCVCVVCLFFVFNWKGHYNTV